MSDPHAHIQANYAPADLPGEAQRAPVVSTEQAAALPPSMRPQPSPPIKPEPVAPMHITSEHAQMAQQMHADSVKNGVTMAKYEASVNSATKIGRSAGISWAAMTSAGTGLLVAGLGSLFFTGNSTRAALAKNFVYGALGGLTGLTAVNLYSKVSGKNDPAPIQDMAQAVGRHEQEQAAIAAELGQAAMVDAQANIPPKSPVDETAIPAQIQEAQAQARQQAEMLAALPLADNAHPVLKQLQSYAKKSLSGQELSEAEQQQAAALLQSISSDPELQKAIQTSLTESMHQHAPTTQVSQAQHDAPVKEAASQTLA